MDIPTDLQLRINCHVKLVFHSFLDSVRVYAWGLCVVGVITHHCVSEADRCVEIIKGSSEGIISEISVIDLPRLFEISYELLSEHLGQEIAGNLWTSRSTAEECSSAISIYLKSSIQSLISQILSLRTLLEGKGHSTTPHRPVCSLHSLILERDCMNLKDFLTYINHTSPLFSGDSTGNSFGIDRLYLVEELGFKDVTGNSISCQVYWREICLRMMILSWISAGHLKIILSDTKDPESAVLQLNEDHVNSMHTVAQLSYDFMEQYDTLTASKGLEMVIQGISRIELAIISITLRLRCEESNIPTHS